MWNAWRRPSRGGRSFIAATVNEQTWFDDANGSWTPLAAAREGKTKSWPSRPSCEVLWVVELSHDSVGQCELSEGLKMDKRESDDGETARKKERASARSAKWGELEGGLMDPLEANDATPDRIPE